MLDSLRDVAAEAMTEARAFGCDPPWETEASFTRLLWHDLAPNGKQRFHRPDVWHTVLLGVGKQFVASAMSILQKALPERSIPARFQHLAHDYTQFCKENHHQKYVNRFDERLFNISSGQEPAGSWNKANVTSIMCRFLEKLCGMYREEIAAQGDPRTQFIDAWIQLYTFFSALLCFKML